MASRHMKICSTPILIREKKILRSFVFIYSQVHIFVNFAKILPSIIFLYSFHNRFVYFVVILMKMFGFVNLLYCIFDYYSLTFFLLIIHFLLLSVYSVPLFLDLGLIFISLIISVFSNTIMYDYKISKYCLTCHLCVCL